MLYKNIYNPLFFWGDDFSIRFWMLSHMNSSVLRFFFGSAGARATTLRRFAARACRCWTSPAARRCCWHGSSTWISRKWSPSCHLARKRRSLGETWKNTKLPNWLVVTGTWMDYDFPYIGNFIIPTDFHIFERGWNHQPAKSWENNRHIEGTNMRSDDLYLSVLRQFGGISDTADWWFPP